MPPLEVSPNSAWNCKPEDEEQQRIHLGSLRSVRGVGEPEAGTESGMAQDSVPPGGHGIGGSPQRHPGLGTGSGCQPELGDTGVAQGRAAPSLGARIGSGPSWHRAQLPAGIPAGCSEPFGWKHSRDTAGSSRGMMEKLRPCRESSGRVPASLAGSQKA